jgi:hypothetical protein
MNTKWELVPTSPESRVGGYLTVANIRLKKLRHERHLVEKAIIALTQIARSRELRDRRAMRH